MSLPTHLRRLIPLVASAIFMSIAVDAHAADFLSAIDQVGSSLSLLGGTEAGSIAAFLADLFVPIINTIAIAAVVISGFAMALSQSEEQATTARRTIIGSVSAIILVNLAAPIRNALLGSSGGITGVSGGGINFDDDGLYDEIIGIADWLASAAATIAVLMIIISGIRAVINWGSDEGVAQIRRTVIAVIAGFTIIVLRLVIAEPIVETGEAGDVIDVIVDAMNNVVGFLGLLAVIVIVIAGIMMVVNIGNEDQYSRAKSLIMRVLIGLLVIFASAGIVNLVFGS